MAGYRDQYERLSMVAIEGSKVTMVQATFFGRLIRFGQVVP
jgi:hypothetical protein